MIMHRAIRLALVLSLPMILGSCEDFQIMQDNVADATRVVAGQGLILGVSDPGIPGVDLSETGFTSGAQAAVFLVSIKEIAQLQLADIGNSPLEGASIRIVDREGNSGNATPEVAGIYLMPPSPDLAFVTDSTFMVEAEVGGELSTAEITVPAPAQISVPQTHGANDPMSINLAGQGFAGVVVVVIAASLDGVEVTYSNQPASPSEAFGFAVDIATAQEDIAFVDIPGSAFYIDNAIYAVGVAGITANTADDLDNFNSFFSDFMAGHLVFSTTSVGLPPPLP
jgi:hypothetical protein